MATQVPEELAVRISQGTTLLAATPLTLRFQDFVHFYNTRDVYPFDITSGHCPSGTIEKVTCWPRPEVKNNEDMTIGKLGLSDKEEDQIVAFLQTLTDGFTTPYPDIDKHTGACATGGSAKTQGNEVLIKTPPLPTLRVRYLRRRTSPHFAY